MSGDDLAQDLPNSSVREIITQNSPIMKQAIFTVCNPFAFKARSRGDKTAIELFLGGAKMLASQQGITKQVLMAILDSSCSEQPSP